MVSTVHFVQLSDHSRVKIVEFSVVFRSLIEQIQTNIQHLPNTAIEEWLRVKNVTYVGLRRITFYYKFHDPSLKLNTHYNCY